MSKDIETDFENTFVDEVPQMMTDAGEVPDATKSVSNAAPHFVWISPMSYTAGVPDWSYGMFDATKQGLRRGIEPDDPCVRYLRQDIADAQAMDLGLRALAGETQAAEAYERQLAAEARVQEMDAALRDMLGRYEIYCGGPELPFAGHTDITLVQRMRAVLARNPGVSEPV